MRTTSGALACVLALVVVANAQTSFYIQSIQQNPDSSVTITWPAVPTWTYQVMFANALDGIWQNFPDGQLTAGTNSLTLCYVIFT